MRNFFKPAATTDQVALGLLTLTWRRAGQEAIELVHTHTNMSDTAVETELWCLRVLAVDFGTYTAFGGQTPTQLQLLASFFLLHELLRTGPPITEGTSAERLATEIQLYRQLDDYLGYIRTDDMEAHARLTSMKELAPSSTLINSRLPSYKRVMGPGSAGFLQSIGGRFAEFCQAQYSPVVQGVGAVQFGEALAAVRDYTLRFKIKAV